MRPTAALSLVTLAMLSGNIFARDLLQRFGESNLVIVCKRVMLMLVILDAQKIRTHNDCTVCCTTCLVIAVVSSVALVRIASSD